MSVSLFGLIAHLEPTTTLLVFIALIVGLIIFEICLHHLEHAAHLLGYEELVGKLYKELTIMGIAGFVVLISFTVFPLQHDDYYLAFEFAHITTFFIAIFLCLRAIFVVYNSSSAAAGLWRAHNISAEEMYERHTNAMNGCTFEGLIYRYFGFFSPLRRYVEYSIIEEYFYSFFCISKTEFRFVDYLTRSYKMYAIALTEISIYSWLIIIFLAIINYIRIITLGSYHGACDNRTTDDHHDDGHSTDDHATDDGHRLLSGGDDEAEFHVDADCADYYIGYFIFCGCLLFLFGIIISFITYYSEKMLLDRALSIIIKSRTNKNDDLGRALQTLAELEKAMENAKVARYQRQGSIASFNPEAAPEIEKTKSNVDIQLADIIDDDGFYHMCTLRAVLKANHHEERQEQLRKQHERDIMRHRIMNAFCCHSRDNAQEESKKRQITELRNRRKNLEMSFKKSGQGLRRIGSEESVNMAISGKGSPAPLHHYDTQRQPSEESSKKLPSDELESHHLQQEVDDVFVGGNRVVYKHIIEAMLMLDALFLSLWVTHFILIANESHAPKLFLTLSVLPILGNFVITSYIQYHSNMLLAVTSLRNEVAVWMCEQDHIKSKTLPLLRKEVHEIMAALPHNTTMEQTIATIFELVNMDGDDRIVLSEFANLLFTLDIHLADTETKVLFSAMDTDGSGSISLDELKELMLEDSVLISKNKETANPKTVMERSLSRMDTFHKLSTSGVTTPAAVTPTNAAATSGGGFSDMSQAFDDDMEAAFTAGEETSFTIGRKNPGAVVPISDEKDGPDM